MQFVLHKIIIAFVISITSLVCYAQNTESEKINFVVGANGGVNISKIKGDTSFDEMEKRKGILTGISINYPLSKFFSFYTEVNYRENGMYRNRVFYTKYAESIGSFDEHFDYNYISVPITLRLSEGEKFKYFIDAGLFVGFLKSASTNAELPEVFNEQTIPEWYFDAKEISKKKELGFLFDFGLEYIISEKIHIVSTVRYYLGLTKLNDYKAVNGVDIKNRSYSCSLGVGYTFEFDTNKKKKLSKRRRK